ncbi:MAG: hypothetical protein EBQ80_03825 [Proteobacteria bacterium]|nr:hypothetical protein [Pseudomonadota bacterium]
MGADNTAGTLYVAPVRSNGSLAGEGFRFGSFFSGSNSNGTIYIGANGGLRGGEGAYVAEGNGTPIRIGATESAYAQQIVTMASNGTRIGAEGFNGGQVVVLTPAQIMAAKERFRKGHTDGRQNLPPASSDADYMEGYRSGLNGQALTV